MIPATMKSMLHSLSRFAWRNAWRTIRQRFGEDRIGMAASSLTFTTVISLVPLFAVVLAVLTAFPMFGVLQSSLQQWLSASLIPDPIARQVMGYLTQFASKASRLGSFGVLFLLLSAISLIVTIERSLNTIWGARRPRSWSQRLVMYWAVLTLGPILFSASLALGSYALSASRGLVTGMPGLLGLTLEFVEFVTVALAVAALYRYVPHASVAWRHAWVGGLLVSCGLEMAKAALGYYLKLVPNFSLVYGAFASAPILLLWIYIVWLLVLLCAVLVAHLPSLLAGQPRRSGRRGWRFALALEMLALLWQQRDAAAPQRDAALAGQDAALSSIDTARRLHADHKDVEEVLAVLLEMGWLGALQDERLVLLVHPEQAALSALVARLLIEDIPATRFMAERGFDVRTRLIDALPR